MPKLKNNLAHMAGQSVNVNGKQYAIEADGTVEIFEQDVVDKLLQNRAAWSLVGPERKVIAKESLTPVVVRNPVVEEKKEEAKPKPKQEPKQEAKEEAKEEAKQVENEESTENEWPDPSPSMSIIYLRQMADAYPEVKYTIKTSKADLIEKIKKAMYSEE